MKLWRTSIRWQLIRVIATAAVVAAILTGTSVALYDVVEFRTDALRRVSTLARMVAFHAPAAFVFDDPEYAASLLQGFEVDEHVVAAVLERLDGKVFAAYHRAGATQRTADLCGAAPITFGHRFEGSVLYLTHPVARDGESLGVLCIAASLEDIQARTRDYLLFLGGVLLACGLFIALLTARLQRVIADPILDLALAAERIGRGDLSTRVDVPKDDELGMLARAFNEMTETLSVTTVSKGYLDDILASMNDALIVVDSEGRIQSLNRAGRQLLGAEEEALRGQPVGTLLGSECCGLSGGKLLEAVEDREGILHRRDGPAVPVSISIAPMGRQGDPSGAAVLVARDIRERKEQERALIEAREAAITASRLKSQFLANISHEMRTPMNGIIGMTELALEADLGSDQREQLETVRSSAEALLRLIDDLLDLSSIEAERMQLESVPFGPGECVMEAMRPLALEAHQKGLEMVVDIAPEAPALVLGDPGRLRQVVTNLLSNAIKFTERGEIVVRVRAFDTGASRVRFLFSVSDTGIGIPPEKQEEIFDLFAQADGSSTRRFGGAGLGLTLSSRLVSIMGGRLAVVSQPERGSTFHFELPFELAARDSEPSDEPPMELQGARALVVDDNQTARDVLVRLLARWGALASGAGSASEARERLAGSEDLESSFDLLILDGELGSVAENELAERLARESEGKREVLFLTPPGRAGSSRWAGASLAKPVEAGALLGALRRSLSSGGEWEPAAGSGAVAAPGASLRILLVEDNPVNCAVVEKTLGKRGHEVVSVSNGRLAVERIQQESYDLVFMDVQMPEMDGIQATQAIREWERASGRHTRIIALTAHAMKGDRERCLGAGMDDYVSKPVKPAVLVQIVESGPSRRSVVAPASPVDSGTDAVFACELLMERIGHDASVLEQILQLFFDETPELVERVRRGLSPSGDPEDARQAAHRLRGMLATMGATRSARVAETLERESAAGRASEAASLVPSLESSLEELSEVLSRLDPSGARSGEEVPG